MIMMRRIARKSVIVGLIFLVAVLFNTAIITENENNYEVTKTEATEPSCC